MHMADALLSPVVGGGMWMATAGVMALSARKLNRELDDRKVPLMGVLGAFIFAAQMINFTIPATGSSGHLGGGLLLAVLLGPQAAFMTMASILTVQALFFADGGLLALGCNIFNLGFFPCFVAYPLIYRPLAGDGSRPGHVALASMVAAVFALQFGAFGVVSQTSFSGITALPFKPFLYMMLPIHLAIGLVEGAATAAVVSFVRKAKPEIFTHERSFVAGAGLSLNKLLVVLLVAAACAGGIFSQFASQQPDGLEWSILKVTGHEEVGQVATLLHVFLAVVQDTFSFFPDYTFNNAGSTAISGLDPGTTIAGLVGGCLTLGLALAIGGLAVWHRTSRPGGAGRVRN